VLDLSAATGLSGVESVVVVLFVAESTLEFSMRTSDTCYAGNQIHMLLSDMRLWM